MHLHAAPSPGVATAAQPGRWRLRPPPPACRAGAGGERCCQAAAVVPAARRRQRAACGSRVQPAPPVACATAAAAPGAPRERQQRGPGSASAPQRAAAAQAPAPAAEPEDWRATLLREALAEPSQLVRLVCKGRITAAQSVPHVRHGASSGGDSSSDDSSSCDGNSSSSGGGGEMPYRQLTVRPVLLKGELLLQVSLLDARQDTTKNYGPQQAAQHLERLLQLPWQSASLQTAVRTVSVQVSRRGRALVQSKPAPGQPPAPGRAAAGQAGGGGGVQRLGAASLAAASSCGDGPISLQHDRVKQQPINGSVPDPFLQKIGLQTADGRIRSAMQAKFTQINEFLKLLANTSAMQQLAAEAGAPADGGGGAAGGGGAQRPVRVLDCGCGSSHLTFGAFHYLRHVRGLPVLLEGVDTNAALMARSNAFCEQLGIAAHSSFRCCAIRDYRPQPPPDIVLALHACDTATDDALVLGARCAARLILSVPCCQKDLHRQHTRRGGAAERALGPLMGHAILRQRQLDLVTDTFRACLLELVGYRAEIVEFVSTEHTPRNLLIRAVRRRSPLPRDEAAQREAAYLRMRDEWGVTPKLEQLLREDGLLALPPARGG